MRTTTGGELTVLASAAYRPDVRVKVANGDGTLKDLTSLGGFNWVVGCQIHEDIDAPCAQATAKFRRDNGALSLAPLMSASTLNVLDDGTTYSALLAPGRRITIEFATVALSATPAGGDWKLMFDG